MKKDLTWTLAGDPPPRKEGWDHTDLMLVYYAAENFDGGEGEVWGIAYYHYNPPHEKSRWIDFNNYGRQPTCWWPLPNPPKPMLQDKEQCLSYLIDESRT